MKSFKTSRIIASILLIAMLFTVSPVSFADTQQYPAYEFVVTADKTSVQTGDTLILTITVNGPAQYANALQYNINYSTSDFTAPTKAADAFEAIWYADVKSGEGFGAIARPGYSNRNGVIKVNYLDQYGENYVDSDSTSEIVGKIVFTAARNIDDIGNCFTLTEAKHAYGTDEGPLRTVNEDETTVVQLSETLAVTKVMSLINAIPSPVTYSSKSAIEAARSAYDAITSEAVKAQITNINILTSAETALKAITDEIDRVKGLIDALDSTSATFEADINEAEEAYNALSEDAKAALPGYDAKIASAKETLAQLKAEEADRAEAAKVDALIDAIGTVTLNSEEAILAAETAWQALTAKQQGYVTKYNILTKAREDYNALVGNRALAVKVEEKINAIPESITNENAEEARELIGIARSAYDEASDAVKALVDEDVYAKLTSAETTLENVDKAEAAKVDALIEAIGTVNLNSESAISAAEKAWQELSAKQQGYVTKYNALTKARADYEALVANRALAVKVEEKINAIPESITNENAEEARELIATAREAYNAASDAVKALVEEDIYAKLTNAEATLENIDKTAAENVDALIDAIGTVTLDSTYAILEAQSAYESLSDAQKKLVTKLDVLLKAQTDIGILIANKQAAQELEELINAIPSPITRENVEEARSAINVARSSYNSAGEAVQNNVSADVYEKLLNAESEIIVADKDIADAVAVEKLIDALGEVSLASKAKLDAIAVKLGELSPAALSYVDSEKIATYNNACERYAVLEAEQAQVQAVIDAIDALGAVEDITLEDKDAIEEAEEAFALLTTALQDRVTNAQTLRDIRAKLNALIKSEADVNNVIKLINEIGEVTLGSSAKINAARSAYDNLTDEEQARVENYEVLTDAEALYKELVEQAEQEELDRTAAAAVDELINAIGTVELTPECEALIKAAEDAYALLTETQKQLVEGAMILAQARVDYDNLKADKEAVDAVIAIIDAIGTVEYSDECLGKIEAAVEAYNALREDLKASVTNADKIEFSKTRYEELKADSEAVASVIDVIDEIGTVSWTKESLEKIEKARAAYNALRDDLKTNVTNADKLTEAEEAYNNLKPVFSQKQDVEAYDGNHMTVITNVPEDMTVSDGTCDAVLIKIGENVYHVFITDHAVDEADIVLRHETPTVHELGNVNGDGRITANDAQMACQYAARNEVEIFETDPLAFIRADVNGSGSITALDALMIANKAAGEDVEFNLLTGLIKQ